MLYSNLDAVADRVTAKAEELIRKLSWADFELYDYAKELVEKQSQRCGGSSAAERAI